MNEDEICRICQRADFASALAEKLASNPNDNWIHNLVEETNKKMRTSEQFFGELVQKYSEQNVAYAVLSILREQKERVNIPVAQPEPSSVPAPAPSIEIPILTPLSPSVEVEVEQNLPELQTKDTKGQEFRADTEGVCPACIGPSLLGMLIVMEGWFVGEDRDFIRELSKQLENGIRPVEEIFKDLYVRLGQEAADALNREIRDVNIVLEEAKKRALKEKPELANVNLD